MYLEIFLADFAVFRVFGGISRDFAEKPEFRVSAAVRNIRSPGEWNMARHQNFLAYPKLTVNWKFSSSYRPVINFP